jgi:hypothetical protein
MNGWWGSSSRNEEAPNMIVFDVPSIAAAAPAGVATATAPMTAIAAARIVRRIEGMKALLTWRVPSWRCFAVSKGDVSGGRLAACRVGA